jgi:uncharacterized hydrophobic protein (TIGR00271 family)
MMHVRVVVPGHLRETVVDYLLDHPTIIHLVIDAGSVQRPDGTLAIFDVPREAANELVGRLRDLGVADHGAIAVTRAQSVFSSTAVTAERLAPGDPTEAVFWEDVKARVMDESRLTVSWVVMLALATLIGACGVLLDSAILVVGAMVIGPDYGPVAAAAIGLHLNKLSWIRRGVVALAAGFGVAIPAAALLTLFIDAFGWTPEVFRQNLHPNIGFVTQPDVFSVIVAVVAGIAGVLSLTQEKVGALVGVLISVTTVPAAAAIGVYGAHGQWSDAAGSTAQLVINLVVLAAIGGVVLRIERWVHVRRARRTMRLMDGPS